MDFQFGAPTSEKLIIRLSNTMALSMSVVRSALLQFRVQAVSSGKISSFDEMVRSTLLQLVFQVGPSGKNGASENLRDIDDKCCLGASS